MDNINWRNLFIIPLFIIFSIMVGQSAASAPFVIFTVVVSLAVAFITFHTPENGLFVLVFSMMLSPEFVVARIPGREVAVRADDLLILVVALAWLCRVTVDKEWKGFLRTPLDKPLALLVGLYVLSTGAAVIAGTVNPLKGFFYALKYIEYLLIYWIAANIISSQDSVRRYLIASLLTCIAVTIYAYSLFGTAERVYAPFDTGGGEPASLGGYYLVSFAILFSLLLHAGKTRVRLICLFMLLLLVPPFVKTLSRASYLAFVPLVAGMFLLTRRRRIAFGIALFIATVLFPFVCPSLYGKIINRTMETFTGSHSFEFVGCAVGGQTINDQSALERIQSWKSVVNEKLGRSLRTIVAGNGITGVGFVEGQFFLVLGELGMVGIVAFYWMIFALLRHSLRIYRAAKNPLLQSLSLALLCVTVALVFQSFTTNTFIIVRIMEPFWFLAGMVVALNELQERNALPEAAPL